MDLILTHIIPSGSNKTLCGLKESKTVIGTSLGLTCDCKYCYEIANKLIIKKATADNTDFKTASPKLKHS